MPESCHRRPEIEPATPSAWRWWAVTTRPRHPS